MLSFYFIWCLIVASYDRGSKKAIKKTSDHNWNMETMQSEKDQENISSGSDYVDMNSKVEDVKAALGNSRRTMDK